MFMNDFTKFKINQIHTVSDNMLDVQKLYNMIIKRKNPCTITFNQFESIKSSALYRQIDVTKESDEVYSIIMDNHRVIVV